MPAGRKVGRGHLASPRFCGVSTTLRWKNCRKRHRGAICRTVVCIRVADDERQRAREAKWAADRQREKDRLAALKAAKQTPGQAEAARRRGAPAPAEEKWWERQERERLEGLAARNAETLRLQKESTDRGNRNDEKRSKHVRSLNPFAKQKYNAAEVQDYETARARRKPIPHGTPTTFCTQCRGEGFVWNESRKANRACMACGATGEVPR